MRTSWLAAFLAWGLSATAALAASADGPYVLADGRGWQALSVVLHEGAPVKQLRALEADGSFTVPAVNDVPAFQVELRPPEAPPPDLVKTSAKAPLLVVADTHGEYQILVALLRAQSVLGAKLEWKFGRGHLVVLGDVFDRGPNHLEILWLLYKLEAEARRAGGGMHLVLGNHETMVMRGDLRYLNAKYTESARVLGVRSYQELFAADTLLGQWLRTRPTLLRVNEFLCLHAGVSRALLDSTLTLADINQTVRAVLLDQPGKAVGAELVMGTLGPLWYRGYFADQPGFPTASMEDVDLALRTFGARRILIGHTIVPTVTPLYEGKVIAVQVYPRRDEQGHPVFESLLIRDGQFFQARLDGSVRRLVKPD
jgi:hypothetical protein